MDSCFRRNDNIRNLCVLCELGGETRCEIRIEKRAHCHLFFIASDCGIFVAGRAMLLSTVFEERALFFFVHQAAAAAGSAKAPTWCDS